MEEYVGPYEDPHREVYRLECHFTVELVEFNKCYANGICLGQK